MFLFVVQIKIHFSQKCPVACLPLMSSAIASPILDGLLTTLIPLASRHAIFDFASPLPPEMIAPACPILLPGGAVCPAMILTTGKFL